jgi:hypothetical protein
VSVDLIDRLAGAEDGAPDVGRRGVGSSTRSTQCAVLFAMGLFGYALVGNLISLLQIDSRVLSIPYRIIVGAFSVYLVSTTRWYRLDGLRVTMLLIWSVYVARLCYDTCIANIEGADYALQFFVIASVLPALALMSANSFDQDKFARAGLVTAAVACVFSLSGTYLGRFGDQDLEETTGRLSTVALNPISLGQLAVGGLFCALVLWREASALLKPTLFVCIAIFAWCLDETGSKGPAVALILGLGLWCIRRGMFLRFCILGIPGLAYVVFSGASALAQRVLSSQEDISTLDRLVLLEDTINQISTAPLLGSAYVELNSGTYPHNIFLESAMAMGIPMAIIVLSMVLVAAKRAWALLKTDADLLGLLFFQALMSVSLSGALFGAYDLWFVLALLPMVGNRTRHIPSK